MSECSSQECVGGGAKHPVWCLWNWGRGEKDNCRSLVAFCCKSCVERVSASIVDNRPLSGDLRT